MLLLLLSLPAAVHGLLQHRVYKSPGVAPLPLRRTSCFMSADDDDSIDPDSLGDWRAFRMNLANAGPSSSSGQSTIDGIEVEEKTEDSSASSNPPSSGNARRPKSVSKKNERLLNSQNAALAEEYLTGAWAHESAVPEVGGLVCRMPLEAEIYRGFPGPMRERLHSLLESEEYGRADDSMPTSLRSSASTGGAASASSGMKSQSLKDSSSGDDDDENVNSSFSALAAKTAFWYRGAQKLIKRELEEIASQAKPNGRIEAGNLGESNVDLLKLYVDHQQEWQEVYLVLEKDRTGHAKTLTINRPLAFKLSETMGRLVLMGGQPSGQGQGSVIPRQESNGVETENLVKFMGAFENECGVYIGGQKGMDKPALMIHGIDDLPGATEISPGTGIYRGGLEAAINGVLSGKYKPLDFRFFIGHKEYAGGQLDAGVGLGKYQPVACSRPLVLKQCIQLPKPLWHEVLEFCGGELKEISKLEFAKRDDLR